MRDFINQLKEDHQKLLSLVEGLGKIVSAEMKGPLSSRDQEKLGRLIQEFIQQLHAHVQKELAELFPALEASLPKEEHWILKMMEIQEEAIMTEALHLHEWSSDKSSTMPAHRLRESVARLSRWIREHVVMEEERLFPKLDDA